MLQNMRNSAQGWIAKAIIAFIALTFAIFGLESLRPNSSNPPVATVNGEKITRQQLLEAVDRQRRFVIQRMGGEADPAQLDEQLLQSTALQGLVQQTVIRQHLKHTGIVISDEMLDDTIRSLPELQDNGVYSPERVRQIIQSLGMTGLQFRNYLREELATSQLQTGIVASNFMTPREIESLLALQNQTRDIAWLTLDAAKARAAITLSDEQLQQRYQQDSDAFMSPEQVSLEYIVLDRNSLKKEVEVSDEEITTRYQSRIEQLKHEHKNKTYASIIVLETGEKNSESGALEQAQSLKKKVIDGAEFASLAREFSEDADSARNGGELGAIEPGFFGPASDKALAELAIGETSDPVVTDFGVMLIRRDAPPAFSKPPLRKMRAALEKEIREHSVQLLFAKRSQLLTDLSFESSDLAEPAERLGVNISQTELFDRQGGKGIAAHPRIVAAAFSNDVLTLAANSEPVEVEPDKLVVVRLQEHREPALKPFAEVRSTIENTLREEQAEAKLAAQMESLLAETAEGDDQLLATKRGLNWSQKKGAERYSGGTDLPSQILKEAFRLPHPKPKQASYGSVVLANGDHTLIAVRNVSSGKIQANEDQTKMMGASLAGVKGREAYSAYIDSLTETSEVKVVGSQTGEQG